MLKIKQLVWEEYTEQRDGLDIIIYRSYIDDIY